MLPIRLLAIVGLLYQANAIALPDKPMNAISYKYLSPASGNNDVKPNDASQGNALNPAGK